MTDPLRQCEEAFLDPDWPRRCRVPEMSEEVYEDLRLTREMEMAEDIKNATIRSVQLFIEDHGILTCFLHLDFGGTGQGFGGMGLDKYDEQLKKRVGTAWGLEYIRRILETLEVDAWEKLPKTPVRVRGATNDCIPCIGHFIKDKWFNPKEDLKFLESQ